MELTIQQTADVFCANSFIDAAKKTGCFSFDVEHDPELHWREEGFKLLGVSFCTHKQVFYVKDMEVVSHVLNELFSDNSIIAIAHNGKYDLICLHRCGLIKESPTNFVDTLCVLNLLDDNLSEAEVGLKPTVFRNYGYKMMDFEEAWSFGPDSPEFEDYAKHDAYYEYRLWVDNKLKLENLGLYKYLTKIMMPALLTFVDVELAGMEWDTGHSIWCFNEFTKIRDMLEKRIYATIGKIDIASPKQLSNRLFNDLGYSTKGNELGKNGCYSTDYDAMEALSNKYPVCKDICLYRSCDKMISTYLTALTVQKSKNFDGRVRGSFWLNSQTGRTRCSGANLQNVPCWYNMDKELQHINMRKCFIARPGFKLVVFDFSQIELRLFAQISRDKTFLKYFREWECTSCNSKGESDTILHSCPKCGIEENEKVLKGEKGFWHGKDLHTNTANKIAVLNGDRSLAKICNFSLIYNIMARTLNDREPKLSISQWQKVIDEFMEEYSGVKPYHNLMELQLKQVGKAKDLFGRIRRFTKDSLRKHFKHCHNAIVNFPTQSSATALSMISMAKTRQHFKSLGTWMKDVFLVNMVHDELVFEVREDLVEQARKDITNIMEYALKFDVPIRVDSKVANKWGECK